MAQFVVPVAVPEPPVELDQVTCVTPTLSLAVPLTTIELAEVDTVLLAGETMDNDGGVVSGAPGGLLGGGGVLGGGAVACCSVTVTLCAAWFPLLSRAVMVITLAPTFRGTTAIVQFGEPCATPENP